MEKKYFNETHEVVISAFCCPVDKDAKEDSLSPHSQRVGSIRYNEPQFNEMGQIESYKVISLHRELIIDIAEQIKKIESETPDMKVEATLPF